MKYKSFEDLIKKIKPLKLCEWNVIVELHQINLRQTEKPFIVPKYEVIIKEDLTFICAI